MSKKKNVLVLKKEEQLKKYLFNWAEAHGLASVPEQIQVNIRIIPRVATSQLDESDWEALLHPQYDWDAKTRLFITLMKESNNVYSSQNPLFSEFKRSDIGSFRNGIGVKLRQRLSKFSNHLYLYSTAQQEFRKYLVYADREKRP
jgi:hypothetical protein